MPLTPEDLAAQASDHVCQDPNCDNLYDLVIFRPRDGEANWLCWVHAFTFLSGVLEAIAAEVTGGSADTPPAPAGPPPDPAEILARYGQQPAADAAGA